jgi:hypothetical protein
MSFNQASTILKTLTAFISGVFATVKTQVAQVYAKALHRPRNTRKTVRAPGVFVASETTGWVELRDFAEDDLWALFQYVTDAGGNALTVMTEFAFADDTTPIGTDPSGGFRFRERAKAIAAGAADSLLFSDDRHSLTGVDADNGLVAIQLPKGPTHVRFFVTTTGTRSGTNLTILVSGRANHPAVAA